MKETRKKNKKYSPEFKITVIMDMRHNHLSYRETIRKYWNTSSRSEEDLYKQTVKQWERIYLTEGQKGFMIERRGKKNTGRPRKKALDKEIKKDLVSENQRLKEEIDRRGLNVPIEVDGGIKADNIARVASYGADIFVAGSSVFGKEDRAMAISELKAAVK